MAQTRKGALAIAAGRLGLTPDDYQERLNLGLKWCGLCRAWQPLEGFGVDRSRGDGLASACIESRRAKARADYTPRTHLSKGRSFVPARDGDKKQARRRVNYFVEAGLIPAPNELPCVDCGHEWELGGVRHEYDHHLGYAAEHHERVEALCSRCHHQRERSRSGKD